MALKKKNVLRNEDQAFEDTGSSNEAAVNEDGKVVDRVTGEEFPEAPVKRQGSGVLTGEVPKKYYGGK